MGAYSNHWLIVGLPGFCLDLAGFFPDLFGLLPGPFATILYLARQKVADCLT
jgi:hypothetical protein